MDCETIAESKRKCLKTNAIAEKGNESFGAGMRNTDNGAFIMNVGVYVESADVMIVRPGHMCKKCSQCLIARQFDML